MKLTTLDDINGLKIRSIENEIQLETLRALGANPTPMPWSELFTALQQGVVDGQQNPIANIYSAKFYEVQDYLTLTNHLYGPSIFLVSEIFWNKLLEEDQALVEKAIKAGNDEAKRIMRGENEKQLQEMEDYGLTVTELDESELEKMQDAVQPVIDQYSEQLGKEFVDSFYQAIEDAQYDRKMSGFTHLSHNMKGGKNMKWLKQLDNNFEEWISFVLFSLMVIVIFLQVIFRFFLNYSLDWTEELSRYTFITLVYFSAAVAVKRNRHLRTESLVQALPKKVKKWINIFSDVIWLAFTVLMIKLSFNATMTILETGQQSPVLKVAMGYVYAVVPIGFILMSLRIIQQIIKKIKNRNNDDSTPTETVI